MGLLAFAEPALWTPVTPPLPAILAVVQVHRHLMHVAPPPFLRRCRAGRGHGQGILGQDLCQPREQAAFVVVAQGELTVAPANRHMHIDRGRRFRQGAASLHRGRLGGHLGLDRGGMHERHDLSA